VRQRGAPVVEPGVDRRPTGPQHAGSQPISVRLLHVPPRQQPLPTDDSETGASDVMADTFAGCVACANVRKRYVMLV